MPTKIFLFMRLVTLNLVFLILFSACDLFYDEGDWKTETRFVDEVSKIQIGSVSDVFFHKSDSMRIDVSYYSNQLSDIKLKVENGELEIKNDFTGQIYTDYRIPRIDLYLPFVSQVTIIHAGNFSCIDTLVGSYFLFRVVGDLVESDLLVDLNRLDVSIESASGLIDIDGKAPLMNLYSRGETKIDATQVVAQNVKVIQQSYLDVLVRTSGFFEYQILRGGNICLFGNPIIEGEVLGTGKLIQYDED